MLGIVVVYWSARDFGPIGNVLPAVIGTSLIVIGPQNALGGFLLAILNGNEAEFLRQIAVEEQMTVRVPVVLAAPPVAPE